MKYNIIISWLVMTVAVIIAAYILPGISVSNFWVALLVALVLGILNVAIRPILIILTLPINILTLGLFTFVINAAIILLASAIIPGFHVAGFWWAVLFSIVLSVVLYIIHAIFPQKSDV